MVMRPAPRTGAISFGSAAAVTSGTPADGRIGRVMRQYGPADSPKVVTIMLVSRSRWLGSAGACAAPQSGPSTRKAEVGSGVTGCAAVAKPPITAQPSACMLTMGIIDPAVLHPLTAGNIQAFHQPPAVVGADTAGWKSASSQAF